MLIFQYTPIGNSHIITEHTVTITEMIFITGFHPTEKNTKVETLTVSQKSLLTTILLYTSTVVLLERSLEQHDNPQIYKHTVRKKGTAQEHLVL